jgi:hypothetical protein
MTLLLLQLAQETPQTANVPNAMGAHTWFIIIAVGAFLAWSISYSIQLQKEALQRKKSREDMLDLKDTILDEIAELETRKEADAISAQKYKQELKDLKFRLSRILEKLGAKS